jgi:acetylglutamate kinase
MNRWIVKLGGAALNDATALNALFKTLKDKPDQQFIIVHGGGNLVDSWLSDAGFVTEKHLGLRISPSEQMPYIVGALAGCANKQLLGVAIKQGLLPVGLTLYEAGLLCEQKLSALGQVGSCIANNATTIDSLLNAGCMPIVSSIGFDTHGNWFNVNADEAAAGLAALLGAELIFMTDVEAVLDENSNPLSHLTGKDISALIAQGVIKGGMQVKVNTSLQAAQHLRRGVYISSWQKPKNLTALINNEHVGTKITP